MRRAVSIVTPLLACLTMAAMVQCQGGRGNAEATVNGKKVSINYGRPTLNGRDMLAQAPVGTVWRLGNNMCTEITSDGTLVVNGTELKAGKYSLWAKRTGEDSWALEFNPKTGVWGAPPLTEGFVAAAPLKLEKASDSDDALTITLSAKGSDADVKIQWGTAVLAGSFGVK